MEAVENVAVVVPDRAGDRALDYLVPEGWLGRVGPGSRVKVSIRNRHVLGVVVSMHEDTGERTLRPIEEVIGAAPLVRPDLMKLADWMADYYGSSIEAALACVLPQAVRSGAVPEKRRKHCRAVRKATGSEIGLLERRAPRQADLLRALGREAGWVPVAELLSATGVSESAVDALVRDGWITVEMRVVGRDPFATEEFVPTSDLELNPAQSAALEAIRRAVRDPSGAKPILLHGVTGSGKTEIYLQAIRQALSAGRTALVLVPEISLTPQTVERFRARFADEPGAVAVLHSHLSAGERRDEWYRIHSGVARIVIGARSAVFAPLGGLGIVIVDEEHEGSYKQEEAPRYHARDLAVLRAAQEGCAVVLGSATPSLESWYNVSAGKYLLQSLPERVDDRKMPIVKVLDLRRMDRSALGEAILSPALAMAMNMRLERGEQSILFLNRRGFSTSMQCPECGTVCECPNCSLALTYHREPQVLACHVCGHSRKAPRVCPECGDPKIRHSGVGTQKVEVAVSKLFPDARVARMDADAMSRKNAYRETLGAFKRGEIDILIGTQMIAKGLDFPNVTLVGIVNADLGLHVADFRAGERTFQLLTQVAGRAGRGEVEGEVFIQTFTPFSPSIQFARHGDFPGFAEQELEFRKAFQFPPFLRMVLLTVRSTVLEKAEFCSVTLARTLKKALPGGVLCGDASPAPLAKAKSYFRFQVALRGHSARQMARHVRQTLDRLPMPEDVFVAVDVDPVSLM